LLNLAIYRAAVALESHPLKVRIGVSLGLAMLAAVLLSSANYGIMFLYDPDALWSPAERTRSTIITISVQTLTEDFFLFAAWATLYTAVTAAIGEQTARRHAATMDASARTAQLRALNYQLNPHFLFNALNTVSALVIRCENEAAERTIDALSDFLRTTLSLNPTQAVRLQDEVRLQHDYLQVEQVRYGDRLAVSIDIPAALQTALVPPLLLQPLVENVVKHAVTRSEAPIRLSLKAEEAAGRLLIVVENDGPAMTALGAGLGLRNVRERLALLYGGDATFEFGALPAGGFKVSVTLPLSYYE
jgi:LytS/YehU family sensor histidine kinase